jgi:hypothetical protein
MVVTGAGAVAVGYVTYAACVAGTEGAAEMACDHGPGLLALTGAAAVAGGVATIKASTKPSAPTGPSSPATPRKSKKKLTPRWR